MHDKKIIIKVLFLKKIFQKTRGLIGIKPRNIFFETRWGIHTFFVKYRINVFILDNNNRVKIKKKLSKNRLFFWNPIYKKVIEIPDNKECKNIKLGDEIGLEIIKF